MGRYTDGGTADFTHGVSATTPRASPGKQTKYLESMNQDQKPSITEKNSSFYETNSDGKWSSWMSARKTSKRLDSKRWAKSRNDNNSPIMA